MQDDAHVALFVYCLLLLLHVARKKKLSLYGICMYYYRTLKCTPKLLPFLLGPPSTAASLLVALSLGVLLRWASRQQNCMLTPIYFLQRNLFFFMRRADWNWSSMSMCIHVHDVLWPLAMIHDHDVQLQCNTFRTSCRSSFYCLRLFAVSIVECCMLPAKIIALPKYCSVRRT